jgi:hypothetical protein
MFFASQQLPALCPPLDISDDGKLLLQIPVDTFIDIV